MIKLDGKLLAEKKKVELQKQSLKFYNLHGRKPHITTILVGDNPASRLYVNNKLKYCEECGMEGNMLQLSENSSQERLLQIIHNLNEDVNVDGILVQLPLPEHIDSQEVIQAIDPNKDVDGFHPTNIGRMVAGIDCPIPATPKGILSIIDEYKIETRGKNVVVIGRSDIVGRPISILLSMKPYDATVTLCHSRTKDLKSVVKNADIVVVAIGKANYIKGDMLKEGAVVIDVGINRVEDKSRERGYRVVGDVDREDVESKCSYLTPVPGGVGPMTICSLFENVFKLKK